MHKFSTRNVSRALQDALAAIPRPQITAREVNAWLESLPKLELAND